MFTTYCTRSMAVTCVKMDYDYDPWCWVALGAGRPKATCCQSCADPGNTARCHPRGWAACLLVYCPPHPVLLLDRVHAPPVAPVLPVQVVLPHLVHLRSKWGLGAGFLQHNTTSVSWCLSGCWSPQASALVLLQLCNEMIQRVEIKGATALYVTHACAIHLGSVK